MPALPIIETTAIDAATTALATLVRARLAGASERVPYSIGHPGSEVESEHIWCNGHVDDEDQEHAVSGLITKDETFTLRVHVLVTLVCDEFHEARARCSALRDLVMNAVRDDFTLGGAVELATVISVEPDQAIPGDGRHSAGDTIRVRCRAYLR